MEEIDDTIRNIQTKEDFVNFVNSLIAHLKTNPAAWTSLSLEDYLEALGRWTEDSDGYYINNNLPLPVNVNWKAFAEILMAASMYE